MVDYYSLLLRAVTAPGAGDAQWRRGIYDRARRMLASRLRTLRPPPPLAEIAAEEAALEAAIERIESELSWTEHGTIAPDARTHDRFGDIGSEPWTAREQGLIATPSRWSRGAWIAVAILAAALGAGGYVYWAETAQKSAPPPSKAEAQNAAAPPVRAVDTASNGELAPGVDGGNSDPDMAYVFRRQPTFYRTLQPVGTIIIDKPQHLSLFDPAQQCRAALRHCGRPGMRRPRRTAAHCEHGGMAALATAARPAQTQSSHDAGRARQSARRALVGARRRHVADQRHQRAEDHRQCRRRFGCIRLANDDVVDLYNRVKVSTPVVVY